MKLTYRGRMCHLTFGEEGGYAKNMLMGENMPTLLSRGRMCQTYYLEGVYAKNYFLGKIYQKYPQGGAYVKMSM